MNKLAVLAILAAGITASHAGPTFAQYPRRFFPRSGQSNNVYRPNPVYAPMSPPARASFVVDARGNRYAVAEPIVSVLDQRRGRWVLGRNQEYRGVGTIQSQPQINLQTPNAKGTTPARPPIREEIGAAHGTNQIGQPAAQGTASTGPTINGDLGTTQATNQIGQPLSSNSTALQFQALAPAMAIATTAPAQTSNVGRLPPTPGTAGTQHFYAANLGIYYQPVHYDDGTFGARLTGAPVPGTPASTLPLDTNDIVFLLNEQRFTTSDDLVKHFGPTTVGYIDSSTRSTQSGAITLPPRGG